ncbi:hypothetical protein FA13DRAFT_858098 [Coprinellus micaceus]|uniref:Uncharacterized protein n=1 Tax=Coprinellus micaceus TaxID=71717 RepID=A0A4Y7T1D8_COPMI|nr:hypothetical protein FA13DRAFT_858098 [Coprinellus micaceus]
MLPSPSHPIRRPSLAAFRLPPSPARRPQTTRLARVYPAQPQTNMDLRPVPGLGWAPGHQRLTSTWFTRNSAPLPQPSACSSLLPSTQQSGSTAPPSHRPLIVGSLSALLSQLVRLRRHLRSMRDGPQRPYLLQIYRTPSPLLLGAEHRNRNPTKPCPLPVAPPLMGRGPRILQCLGAV